MNRIQDIDTLDLLGKNIFIVGKPAAGKTHTAKQLHNRFIHHTLVHSDDFNGMEYLLAQKIRSITQNECNYIFEGNHAFTILEQLDKGCYPDIILYLDVPDAHVLNVYMTERDISKHDSAMLYYHYRDNELTRILASISVTIPIYSYSP